MGMSSSQARLLTLTGRMHDIEYKAQRLEAQKLQMANDSARAYEDYLLALEATKIQYKKLTENGSITYNDVNMNILQNGVIAGYTGEHSDTILFLQRKNGTMMVTRAVADAYNIPDTGVETRDMDTYIEETTGETKSPVYGTKWIDDTTQIIGFTPIANSNYTSCGVASYTYDDIAVNSTVTTTNVADDSLVAGTTYTISTVEDLKHLSSLVNNGEDSSNVTFVLTNNINMSGVTDFIPIGTGNAFKGTFDGNGYAIQNLSMNITTNAGLFSTLDNATVKNVNLTNINYVTTAGAGGIAGGANNNSFITNCSVTGSITAHGFGAGGFVSGINSSTITNCYSNTTINHDGSNYSSSRNETSTGGFVGSINGATISNCMAEGSINGAYRVGGFVGNSSAGSNYIQSTITNCYTTCSVASQKTSPDAIGSFMGLNMNQDALVECKSTKTSSSLDFVGRGTSATEGNPTTTSNPTNFSNHSANTTGAIAMSELGKVTTTTNPTIPSINTNGTGGFYSNILAALNKAGIYDSNSNSPADIPNKVKTFILSFNDNDADNSRLWHLNQQLVNYLNSTEGANAFTTALSNDINAGTSNATNAYQNIGTLVDAVRQTNDTSWTPTYHAASKGTLTIPNIQTIKSGVEVAFQKAGFSTTSAQINAFFNQYNTSNATDLAYLANINDLVNNYANTNSTSILTELKNAIESNQKMQTLPTYISDPANYDITMNSNVQDVNISYKQIEVEDPTNILGYEWDTTNPAIAEAMSMWKFLQKGVEIVEEPLASSSEYLNNLLQTGEVVLTTYEPGNFAQLNTLPSAEIQNMSDSQYDKIMGIENTSVATNTSLREVKDETNLRKAEAEYEANMLKIDRKDRKFDQDLAALDAERNAIKQEMETLKTVIKENVERTFRLFS